MKCVCTRPATIWSPRVVKSIVSVSASFRLHYRHIVLTANTTFNADIWKQYIDHVFYNTAVSLSLFLSFYLSTFCSLHMRVCVKQRKCALCHPEWIQSSLLLPRIVQNHMSRRAFHFARDKNIISVETHKMGYGFDSNWEISHRFGSLFAVSSLLMPSWNLRLANNKTWMKVCRILSRWFYLYLPTKKHKKRYFQPTTLAWPNRKKKIRIGT